MTHTPPIPAGNQSPYPLHEAPHAKTPDAPPPGDARVARTPDPSPHSDGISVPTAIGIAAGVGIAAIAGGLFWAFSGNTKPKPKPRKKRKPAKQAD